MEIQGKELTEFKVFSKLRVRDSRKCLLKSLQYYLNTYQNIKNVART